MSAEDTFSVNDPTKTDSTPYKYAPLTTSDTTFRLVKLLRPQRSCWPPFNQTLRIKIVEADLDDPPQYDALSYTWGDGGRTRQVIVENSSSTQILHISKSLEQALLQLGGKATRSSLGSGLRPVFVDQICIDQHNPAEKATLVPLMGRIYASCQRVVIWLGTGTRQSDRYFDYVRALNAGGDGVLARIMGPRQPTFRDVLKAVQNPEIAVEGTMREDRDDILVLLSEYSARFPLYGAMDVISRPWFTRLWVIQEMSLGPQVSFACGSRAICSKCFRAGILFYSIYINHWVATVGSPMPMAESKLREHVLDLNNSVIRLFQERMNIHFRGSKQACYDVVLKYNVNDKLPKIRVSRPEDRLFGLLGIVAEHDTTSKIQVRYANPEDPGDTTTAAVFTEFAANLIQKNVDLLSFSQMATKRIAKLPTWVPDWSADLATPHGYLELKKPAFKAGLVTNAAIEYDPPRVCMGSKTLIIQGFRVDEVSLVGKCTMSQDLSSVVESIDYVSVKKFFDEIQDFLEKASQVESSPYQGLNGEELLQIRIRLSVFGLTAKHLSETSNADDVDTKLKAMHQQEFTWAAEVSQFAPSGDIEIHRFSNFLGLFHVLARRWSPLLRYEYLYFYATNPVVTLLACMTGVSRVVSDIVRTFLVSITLTILIQFLLIRQRVADFRSRTMGSANTTLKRDADIARGLEMKPYRDHMLRATGLRLYVTKRGYIGLGPEHLKKDDVLVVILGGTVPHFLRPASETSDRGTNITDPCDFFYVGEAYCYGIMEGQLLTCGLDSEMLHIR